MNVKQSYREILFQLERDGRNSLTEIGKKAGTSQQTTSYAVKKMENEELIRDYYPLFDYTKFGYRGYISFFRVNTFSREKLEELVEMFKQNEMVAWIQRLAGGWDLMIFFLAPNASYFNKEFKSLVSQHPEQLQNYRILTSVVIHDLERTYLTENRQNFKSRDTIIGGDREVLELKDAEEDTCKALNEKPRESTVEIGEKLGVTSKTVIERIRNLEDRKLVKGYRPLLGIPELDVSTNLLFISYTSKNVEKEDELVNYCKAHENVTLVMKTFGDWDVMLRLETDGRQKKQDVVQSIREKFEEIILDYDTLEVLDDIKKKYLPPGHFKDEAFQPVEE